MQLMMTIMTVGIFSDALCVVGRSKCEDFANMDYKVYEYELPCGMFL